jgi:ankyrin repeat protein
MEACWRGDLEEVRRLIAEGSDVNAQNVNGTTPLMYAKTHAFSSGDVGVMRLLIESGADVHARDKHGKTALDYTIERCALIKDLLQEAEMPRSPLQKT